MSRKTVKEKINLTELTVPAFGYELIREDFIEEILGEDAPSILYWVGKHIARKYPLFSFDEIQEFFLNAGWGTWILLAKRKVKSNFN